MSAEESYSGEERAEERDRSLFAQRGATHPQRGLDRWKTNAGAALSAPAHMSSKRQTTLGGR